MNKLIIILFSLLSTTLLSQSKDESEVAKAVEALRVAMLDGNKTSLEKIAADNLSYGHSGGKIENKAEFVEAFASGKSDFVSITLSEQTIQLTDNIAVVRHKLDGETKDLGKAPGTAHIAVMLVWIKQKGDWKLLARQAVKLQ